MDTHHSAKLLLAAEDKHNHIMTDWDISVNPDGGCGLTKYPCPYVTRLRFKTWCQLNKKTSIWWSKRTTKDLYSSCAKASTHLKAPEATPINDYLTVCYLPRTPKLDDSAGLCRLLQQKSPDLNMTANSLTSYRGLHSVCLVLIAMVDVRPHTQSHLLKG